MVANYEDAKSRTTARKPYQKPTLAKVAVLSAVTAQTQTSSLSDSNNACWVARAAFGETDFRWMIFRAWLLDDAPAWFRRLYIRYGELVGAWLASRENARRVVRAAMMPAINRKLQSWQRRFL
jgi:uncharacterized protein YbjT (DUF2867 family)